MEVEKRDNFRMRKYLLITLLMIQSVTGFAANTVRINPDIDLVVNARTDTTYTLRSDEASGDATSEAAPAKVYVPVQSGYTSQADYFFLKASNPVYNYLFDITDNTHVIIYPLYINVSATAHYLYAAVKDGTSWKVIASDGISRTNVINGTVPFEVQLSNICGKISTAPNCSIFDPTNNITGDERNTLVYIFLSEQSSIADGATITITDPNYDGGIYFETNLSNRIYPNLVITATNARSGDKRVTLTYTANSTILDPLYVKVFERSTPGTISTIVTPGTVNAEDFPFQQNSEVVVRNLVNDQSYNLSVFFLDKYNFTTQLSTSIIGKPLEVQELLKKQSCFLLTAGFGEEHYVIDYFRHFRDTVLSKNFLGRQFIGAYYEYAPKYALIIYEHEAVRATVRGAAYVLYFIFNYFVFILITSMTLLTAIYLYKNKEKIKI